MNGAEFTICSNIKLIKLSTHTTCSIYTIAIYVVYVQVAPKLSNVHPASWISRLRCYAIIYQSLLFLSILCTFTKLPLTGLLIKHVNKIIRKNHSNHLQSHHFAYCSIPTQCTYAMKEIVCNHMHRINCHIIYMYNCINSATEIWL